MADNVTTTTTLCCQTVYPSVVTIVDNENNASFDKLTGLFKGLN